MVAVRGALSALHRGPVVDVDVVERLLTDVGDEINDRQRVSSETPAASESTDDRYARFHRRLAGWRLADSLARLTTICGNNDVIDHRLTATMPSTRSLGGRRGLSSVPTVSFVHKQTLYYRNDDGDGGGGGCGDCGGSSSVTSQSQWCTSLTLVLISVTTLHCRRQHSRDISQCSSLLLQLTLMTVRLDIENYIHTLE